MRRILKPAKPKPGKALGEVFPELSPSWNYEANYPYTPMTVGYSSAYIATWTCEVCEQDWDAHVYNRTNVGAGCPVCAGKVVVEGINDLESQDPPLAKQWDLSVDCGQTPKTVTVYSHFKAPWVCEVCDHRWRANVCDRSNGNGCAVCAGREIIVGYNDFGTKQPEVATEWDYSSNGDRTPQTVTEFSDYRAGWVCSECGHKWRQAVKTRSLGCGCPACANSKVSHIEGRLRALIGASPILKILDHEKDVRLNLPWGKSNHLKVDILAYTARTGAPVVIEYDGAGWHQSDQAIARDSAKTKALLAAGFKVVRVRQTPLPELDIEDDNLKQYRIKWYRNDTALQAVVDELELWA